MRLDTKRNIGNAGIAVAIAYFGANGYTVSLPLNDTQNYDLVVDIDGILKKVQVKATNYINAAKSYVISLRTVSGTTRKVTKTVCDTDVDLLFCLVGDGSMFLIPIDKAHNRNTINLRTDVCNKYSQYQVYI